MLVLSASSLIASSMSPILMKKNAVSKVEFRLRARSQQFESILMQCNGIPRALCCIWKFFYFLQSTLLSHSYFFHLIHSHLLPYSPMGSSRHWCNRRPPSLPWMCSSRAAANR